MPQKILYVITQVRLGEAKYVFDLATRLPRDTHDVAVAWAETALAGRLTAADIRVINVPALERDISFGKDGRPSARSSKSSARSLRTRYI